MGVGGRRRAEAEDVAPGVAGGDVLDRGVEHGEVVARLGLELVLVGEGPERGPGEERISVESRDDDDVDEDEDVEVELLELLLAVLPDTAPFAGRLPCGSDVGAVE